MFWKVERHALGTLSIRCLGTREILDQPCLGRSSYSLAPAPKPKNRGKEKERRHIIFPCTRPQTSFWFGGGLSTLFSSLEKRTAPLDPKPTLAVSRLLHADRCGPRSRKVVVRPRFSSAGRWTASMVRTRWQNLAFATFQLPWCHRGRAPSSTGARHDGRTGRRYRREGR